ncbi:MAG: aspartate/glutamate racemase family protein [Sphaerochaetaceae bacterium]|nr:aspartate/glutamate racemase family protein [Sphaerochaetaceae bacterium]
MIPKIALVHTVPTVYLSFAQRLLEEIPSAVISNTVDEFLASDAEIKGEFTKNNLNRLLRILKAAEETEADVIAVTCSTLSPSVAYCRPFFSVPLVTIDERMIGEAVKLGPNILVVSTAGSTIGPTFSKLRKAAADLNSVVHLEHVVCQDAYVAIKQRNQALHDQIVLETVKKIDPHHYDAIVLAQASMAHLEAPMSRLTGLPVLSSPRYCVLDILSVLGNKGLSF